MLFSGSEELSTKAAISKLESARVALLHKNLKGGKDPFDAEMAHFVDCIVNGTPCRATAEDGITVMKILDAIYESAITGHEVLL